MNLDIIIYNNGKGIGTYYIAQINMKGYPIAILLIFQNFKFTFYK